MNGFQITDEEIEELGEEFVNMKIRETTGISFIEYIVYSKRFRNKSIKDKSIKK